ncbi:hypothetical protein ACFZBM_11160 [Streptomyces lavendulae]|uniref:hypothetical protein n=1 Tax=Streptomyces lavendulae TaxID=1914 RepID=UPI0036E31337
MADVVAWRRTHVVGKVTLEEAERLARAFLRGEIRGWTDDGWTLGWDEWATREDGYVFVIAPVGGVPVGAPVFVGRTDGACRLMPAREYSRRRRPRSIGPCPGPGPGAGPGAGPGTGPGAG